jgi:hypothetical protein
MPGHMAWDEGADGGGGAPSGPARNTLSRRRGAALRGRAARDAVQPDDSAEAPAVGSVLSNLGRQNNSAEAQRGHAIGRTMLGATGVGLLVFLLVSEGFAETHSSSIDAHKLAARERLLGKQHGDSVQRFMRLTDSTDDCSKTVYYEACIPALFNQGCSRFPVTGPCESEFCPRNCTGHGRCEERDDASSCACEAGFTGHFCATQLCPADCSGHGRCHAMDGTCDCDDGYGGLDCSQVQCVNNCTQPNGVCDVKTGICTCGTGYTGIDCSHEPQKLYNESWGLEPCPPASLSLSLSLSLFLPPFPSSPPPATPSRLCCAVLSPIVLPPTLPESSQRGTMTEQLSLLSANPARIANLPCVLQLLPSVLSPSLCPSASRKRRDLVLAAPSLSATTGVPSLSPASLPCLPLPVVRCVFCRLHVAMGYGVWGAHPGGVDPGGVDPGGVDPIPHAHPGHGSNYTHGAGDRVSRRYSRPSPTPSPTDPVPRAPSILTRELQLPWAGRGNGLAGRSLD